MSIEHRLTAHGRRSRPGVTLAVLCTAGLAYGALTAGIVPALPAIQRELHATETGLGWLLTGFLLAGSVATSILGRLGDMYGKEKLLLWTLVILAFGTLLAAVSRSLGVLIVARVIQGAGGGIFPLAFGIVRDEFPREKVTWGIGLVSAILGVGGGVGIVLSGVIVEHLDYHWLFWLPLVGIVTAAACSWWFVPESPVRVPGRVNWTAGALMSIGISLTVLAISQTTEWGWGSSKTLGMLGLGVLTCCAWIAVELRSKEPLIDMSMMRIRGVWTTNAAAFLLGAGMYASLIVIPQFVQLPASTGFGFGASIVVSGLYLLPFSVGVFLLGLFAGRLSSRFGSKLALVGGTASTTAAFGLLALAHGHPYNFLLASTLLGVGIGLAFAALGALIVEAVPAQQTGVASGMNTVMRTLGGALGGQLSATFLAANDKDGLPTVTGFSQTFAMATGFLVACMVASLLVPGRGRRRQSIGVAERAAD